MPKAVIFISEDFYVLSHRKQLLQGLTQRGWECTLATNVTFAGYDLQELGIPIEHINLHRESFSPIKILSAAAHYRRTLNRVKPDIVLAVALKPIYVLSLALFMGRRCPAIFAFAGLGAAYSEHTKSISLCIARKVFALSFPLLLRQPGCFCLFQNEDDRSFFVSKRWVRKERSQIIPGAGVDLKEFACTREVICPPIQFLFVGRALWDKGIMYLVEACKILKAKGYPFSCKLAGLIDKTNKSAVPLSYLEDQNRLGNIEWLGSRTDVPMLMRSAHCMVFPSVYREGVPKVLLEAAASGLPAITTDIPGCRDVVQNEITGLIVKPHSASELAKAMERVLVNPKDLIMWGLNARKKAELEYDVQLIIERHDEMMHQCLRSA